MLLPLQDTQSNRLFIVLEFCAGGDLGHYIKRYRQVSEATARYFLQQLAEGLKELRRHNVIHVGRYMHSSAAHLQQLDYRLPDASAFTWARALVKCRWQKFRIAHVVVVRCSNLRLKHHCKASPVGGCRLCLLTC